MTRDQLFKQIIDRNPGLITGRALTANGFKKMFDLIWDEAQREIATCADVRLPEFLAGIFAKGRGVK